MTIDEKKDKRQDGQVQTWIEKGCQGTLQAVTGYGKTRVAIKAIQRLHRKYPDVQVDVVVPKTNLQLDWIRPKTGHIAKFNLKNVNVFVVNTYIKLPKRKIGLLIPDEGHRYASEEFSKVFEVAGCVPYSERNKQHPYILLLTATLERLDGKHTLLEKYCPIFDTVTMEEARREGYISNYKIYNLGLKLSEKDEEEYNKIHSTFNSNFAKFEHRFELAMACSYKSTTKTMINIPVTRTNISGQQITSNEDVWKSSAEWCYWWSKQRGWEGQEEHDWSPKNVSKYAQLFSASMRSRKKFIYTASVKKDTSIEIINKFPVKAMVFAEDHKFADSITERLGSICKSYHTYISGETRRIEIFTKSGQVLHKEKYFGKDKVKQFIIEDFKKPNGIRVISTVRSLNEGFDYEGVRLAIMASYNSSKIDDTQRKGRAGRKDYADLDKIAVIVNLYIIDTQEEKWLREKQRGTEGIIWITSVDEITMDLDLFNIKLI